VTFACQNKLANSITHLQTELCMVFYCSKLLYRTLHLRLITPTKQSLIGQPSHILLNMYWNLTHKQISDCQCKDPCFIYLFFITGWHENRPLLHHLDLHYLSFFRCLSFSIVTSISEYFTLICMRMHNDTNSNPYRLWQSIYIYMSIYLVIDFKVWSLHHTYIRHCCFTLYIYVTMAFSFRYL